MLTEDYLMRQIRLFTAALARALGLKTMQLHQDAIFVLEQALENLFGLSKDVLNRMDDEGLIAAVRSQDKGDLSRLRMAAELYHEAANLYAGLEEAVESRWRLIRALNLFLEVELSGGAPGFTSANEQIIAIINRLTLALIPPDLLYPLYGWAQQAEQPAFAVPTLIRLLEAYPGEAELVSDGRAYLDSLHQSGLLADPAYSGLKVAYLQQLLGSAHG